MRRSTFIGLCGASAAGASALDRTPDEVSEDAEICRVASELIQSFAVADFKVVAQPMHPSALKLVYDSVATGFEQLSERHSEKRVLEVIGLTGHPKTLGLSHSAFFVHILELLNSMHPGFSAIPPERALKIIGGIVDPQDIYTFAHIL